MRQGEKTMIILHSLAEAPKELLSFLDDCRDFYMCYVIDMRVVQKRKEDTPQIPKSDAALPPRVPSRPSWFISRSRPSRKVCESFMTAHLLRGSPARLPSSFVILPPWSRLRLGRFCLWGPRRGRILRRHERMDREGSRQNCRRSRRGARKWSRFLRSHRNLSDWRKHKTHRNGRIFDVFYILCGVFVDTMCVERFVALLWLMILAWVECTVWFHNVVSIE